MVCAFDETLGGHIKFQGKGGATHSSYGPHCSWLRSTSP
jgi:hypothetical protein